MTPPPKRPKRSKIPKISLSAPRVLNSNSPILRQDIHNFITTALSPTIWDQYSEAEKGDLIALFPTACRVYNVDAEGKLECPVSIDFLQSDTYVKASVARFKRDIKDGYWEVKWQNQAKKAMQERKEGKFDSYLQEHAEDCFGEEGEDQAEEDDEGHSESDWEQDHGKKKAEEEEEEEEEEEGEGEEYIVERLLRLSPCGTQIEVKWHGYNEPTWESRAGLLEDLPEMVAAMEARQSGNTAPAAVQDEEYATTLGNTVVLSSRVDVEEGSDAEMRDVAVDRAGKT